MRKLTSALVIITALIAATIALIITNRDAVIESQRSRVELGAA